MNLNPGINHLEIWVSNIEASQKFYKDLFSLIGWKNIRENIWSSGVTEIYLREEAATSKVLSLGVHHLCFQAVSRDIVDKVGTWLTSQKTKIFAGPIEMDVYSPGYYTVDFYDPDGMILEVCV